jgi:DNA-binding GntR family transcriptional regulator
MTESNRADAANGATTEWVADTLRERIVEGDLRPGTPLREVTVAEELRVSRNTLREALRLLAMEDLVDMQRYRGVVVKVLSAEEIRDIYIVRRTVELRAVEDNALASEASMASLQEAAAVIDRAVAAGSWREVGTASLRFHQALVATLDSPRLDAFFRTIVAQIRLAFAAVPDENNFQQSFVPRDREICDLLIAGSRAAAGATLRRYLDDSERAVIELVRLQAAQTPTTQN